MEKCNWGKTQTIAKWRVAKWLAICTQIIGSWFESGPSPAVLWIDRESHVKENPDRQKKLSKELFSSYYK